MPRGSRACIGRLGTFTLAAVKRLATGWAATILFALAPASMAFAGGTSSGSDTSSTAADDTGTSTGDASSSSTTEGMCEVCPPSTTAGNIEFSDLDHGQPPAGDKLVEVSAQPKCSCDDCMCFDDEPTQIRLELDGDAVGDPCASAQCEFTVTLTPGPHELTAFATYQSGEVSETVELVVPSDGGTTETGTPMMQDDGDDGCGCTSSPRGSSLALVVIAAALGRRRSRR